MLLDVLTLPHADASDQFLESAEEFNDEAWEEKWRIWLLAVDD